MSNMYWEYAGTRYRQKFLAIQAAGKNVNSITFNAFSNVFHNYDWSIEPSTPFSKLCDLRAQQLRDQYSYIKLYFSGGADSTTMLNAFLRTNTFIDEIVIWRLSLVNDFNCFSNSEANDFAIPYIKSLNLPKTKIKILDIGHEYYSKLLEGDKFIYTKNNIDLRETFIPKIRGKNFCHLLGDFEPCIIYEDGKWYEQVFDSNNLVEYKYRSMEGFFTSEHLPELHAKQCHLVKNYLKNINKDAIRTEWQKVVREKPIASVPKFIKPRTGTSFRSLQDMMSKDFVMLKARGTKELRDKYYGILSQKINNKRLIDIVDGIKGETFCLGN